MIDDPLTLEQLEAIKARISRTLERQKANRKRAYVRRRTELEETRAYIPTYRRLTEDEYQDVLASQEGRCALCFAHPYERDGKQLAVDHDHRTGQTRGLLCGPCNRRLGLAGDSVEQLLRDIRYLKYYGIVE